MLELLQLKRIRTNVFEFLDIQFRFLDQKNQAESIVYIGEMKSAQSFYSRMI